MHAQREKERNGRTDLSEIKPLRQILPRRFVARSVFVGHKQVAEINVKVRLVGADVGERLLIHCRAGVLIQMHVRRHGKSKTAASRTRGVERKLWAVCELRCASGKRMKLIEVFRVSLQRADY